MKVRTKDKPYTQSSIDRRSRDGIIRSPPFATAFSHSDALGTIRPRTLRRELERLSRSGGWNAVEAFDSSLQSKESHRELSNKVTAKQPVADTK